MTANESIDAYFEGKERIVLTRTECKIPGLRTFARHKMSIAGYPLKEHYHKNSFEFTFLLNGSLSFCVQDEEYDLSGYDVFITHPNEIHSTRYKPLSKADILWFQLDISDPEGLLFLSPEMKSLLIERLGNIGHVIYKLPTKSVFSLLSEAFSRCHQGSDIYYSASILTFLLFLLCDQSSETKTSVSEDMYHAQSYIQSHITQAIPLEAVASHVHLSCSQLKHKFKREIGISPRNYINIQKIEYAKKLLLTGMAVTQVSAETGFCTSSYFGCVFKKYCRCTPKEYVAGKQPHK